VRVVAEPVVIVRDPETQTIGDIMEACSSDTDLSLLGLKMPSHVGVEQYCNGIELLMSRIGSVLLVHSAQKEDILDID
jgi:hypothetical protein